MRVTDHVRPLRRGAALAELLVALVLLGVGAASLAGGMRSATRSVAQGAGWSLGAFAAESRMEDLRARCGMGSGVRSLGPVTERWGSGARAGPLLQSLEVEDTIAILLTTGTSGRLVRSIARCLP